MEDVRGKEIKQGIHVRYTGTGSTGEVIDLKSDDEEAWVLLDTTNLWYKTKFVEIIGESEYNKMKNHTIFKSEEKQEEDTESIKGKIKKSKGNFEDVDMSNELCDGGG